MHSSRNEAKSNRWNKYGNLKERAVTIKFNDSCTRAGATKHSTGKQKERGMTNKTKGVPVGIERKIREKNPHYTKGKFGRIDALTNTSRD